jgi:DNA invertase Pin-like site-specific DNA recombinase
MRLKTDAKNLSPRKHFQIHKHIVRLEKQVNPTAETAEFLDISRRHVESTLKKYKEDNIH